MKFKISRNRLKQSKTRLCVQHLSSHVKTIKSYPKRGKLNRRKGTYKSSDNITMSETSLSLTYDPDINAVNEKDAENKVDLEIKLL